MKKLFTQLLLSASIVTSSQNGNSMDKDVIAFFKSKYEDPVIEQPDVSEPAVLPSCKYFRVFERKQLVEDPLIPDIWLMTSKKKFFRSGELDKALADQKITPSSEQDALFYAKTLVKSRFNAYYAVTEQDSFSNVIPKQYLNEKFYPKILKDNSKYSVTVYFYFPDSRSTRFWSFFSKQLVEFLIEIDGFNYSIQKTEVTSDYDD